MNRGDYAETQRTRDRQYAKAWEQLTPEQRQQLRDAGIEGPELPSYDTHKRDDDELMARTVTADTDETSAEEPQGQVGCSLAALRRVFGEIASQENIPLSLDCFSIATGIGYSGESMAQIAKIHGVTRAAVSKRCVEITNALRLKPTRAMRRLTTRETYGQRARNTHARSSH